MIDGDEQDVLTGWRAIHKYTQRSKVCKNIKSKYNRRFRKRMKSALRDQQKELE